MKRPAFQFYPGDWLRDAALRSCSVGARGLWIDMICLMHDGEPYGHLRAGSKIITPTMLARMVGAEIEDVESWLQELSDAMVYTKDNKGAIYSRRMVRDEEIRAKRAAGGAKGGNPALMHQSVQEDPKVNLRDNLTFAGRLYSCTPPSSSSASSSSSAESSLVQLTTEHLHGKRAHKAGSGTQCSTVHCFFNDGWMPETEKQFVALMTEIGPGMENFGGLWRNRWRGSKHKCIRVLSVLKEDAKQKVIENPGGYMNDLWTKRMA